MARLASGDRPVKKGTIGRQQERSNPPSAVKDDDQSAEARLREAKLRDAEAQARDIAALARDQAAVARDVAMTQAGGEDAALDDAPGPTGSESVIRAAGRRRRARNRRAKAAEYRAKAADDRLMAERDREAAAAGRRRSLDDHKMLVVELQRQHELRDDARRHQHRAEQLARTLQRSLSPPSLPHIVGLDVAVHYEPSAPEDVGGDFYDLFPLMAGRSGFFLGDVCGKGPEAAAVTSLARYTMRTAAMLHEEPEAILMDLNAALLMGSPELPKTCTAVYGQIDMRTDAATVTLAVGGHPAPTVVRSDGTVQTTPAHGTMLGAVDDPRFHTCEINLGLDDALVICSDGILDTELDGIRIDEQGLVELLSGASQVTAQGLVERLMDALRGVDRPLRDDVAIMALRRTP